MNAKDQGKEASSLRDRKAPMLEHNSLVCFDLPVMSVLQECTARSVLQELYCKECTARSEDTGGRNVVGVPKVEQEGVRGTGEPPREQ